MRVFLCGAGINCRYTSIWRHIHATRIPKNDIKASCLPTIAFKITWSHTHESQTMRFSSAIALTVIVALASSISAMPTEGYAAGANQCIRACYSDSQCRSQDCTYYQCTILFFCLWFVQLINTHPHIGISVKLWNIGNVRLRYDSRRLLSRGVVISPQCSLTLTVWHRRASSWRSNICMRTTDPTKTHLGPAYFIVAI